MGRKISTPTFVSLFLHFDFVGETLAFFPVDRGSLRAVEHDCAVIVSRMMICLDEHIVREDRILREFEFELEASLRYISIHAS